MFLGAFVYGNTQSKIPYQFRMNGMTGSQDYLFDYNYLGRSESTGLFSQQYIQAEGGFKSKLNNPFANQWMTTINGSCMPRVLMCLFSKTILKSMHH